MCLRLRFSIVMVSCIFFYGFIEMFCGEDMSTVSENPETPDAVVVDSIQSRFQVGDVIHCNDGSSYIITDLSQYSQEPAEFLCLEVLTSILTSEVPQADTIHFSDISGDYLFVKNLYEMYRMLYTLFQTEDAADLRTQFCIPEDAVPTVLETWDIEQLASSFALNLSNTYCLESWDIYKNGSFQKTVYLIAEI